MAMLGGDDAGGGVVWAPEVIQDAADHGLVLAETGVLYNTKNGEQLPRGVSRMLPMSAEHPELLHSPTTDEVVPHYVARYADLLEESADAPVRVLGEDALIRDRPGFEVDFISRESLGAQVYTTERHEILMPFRGHWRIDWDGGTAVLNPGDTCAVPPGLSRCVYPSMSGESGLYRVRTTDDSAGPTWPL